MSEIKVQSSTPVPASPNYGLLVKVCSLSVALLMYLTSMTTPGLALIQAGLPDATPEQIALISSIPSLMLVVGSLLSGFITRFISIKKTILLGAVLSFVGVLPAMFGGIEFILFTRVVFGLGYGMIFMLASAVIVDLYSGATRDAMMGFKSAAGSVAGVVFQMLGGVLASINWRYCFWGFLLCIPITLFVLFALPDTGVKKKEQLPSELKNVSFFKRFGIKTYGMAAIGFLHNIFQFSFMIMMAAYLVADGIGGEGAATLAASVLSMFTAASFVAGISYVFFAKVFKQFTAPVGALIVGIGFLVASVAQQPVVFFIAAAIFGLGFGYTNASYTLTASSGAKDKAYTPMAISIYVALVGLGQFCCAYILKWLAAALNITASRPYWVMARGVMIVAPIIAIIVVAIFSMRKKTTNKA